MRKLLWLIVGLFVGALLAPTQATFLPFGVLTPTAAAGTTILRAGGQNGQPYVVTVDKTAFVCNATTCDVTLATAPAKTKITGIVADLTTVFACSATCTSTGLTFTAGKTSGGTEYLLSSDAHTAIGQFGTAAAQSGASLAASIVQSGDITSWSGTTTLSVRLISAVGAVGNGSVTNLSTGSITFYILADFYGS